jgi:hypothetical protein
VSGSGSIKTEKRFNKVKAFALKTVYLLGEKLPGRPASDCYTSITSYFKDTKQH